MTVLPRLLLYTSNYVKRSFKYKKTNVSDTTKKLPNDLVKLNCIIQ